MGSGHMTGDPEQVLEAAANGRVEAILNLLKTDRSILNIVGPAGCTVAHIAAFNGCSNILKLVSEYEATLLSARAEGGETPAHSAAAGGFQDCLAVLGEHDIALLEEGDDDGWTPLHSAALYGHFEAVCYLVSHASSTLACKTKDGLLAIAVASRPDCKHMLSILQSTQEEISNASTAEAEQSPRRKGDSSDGGEFLSVVNSEESYTTSPEKPPQDPQAGLDPDTDSLPTSELAQALQAESNSRPVAAASNIKANVEVDTTHKVEQESITYQLINSVGESQGAQKDTAPNSGAGSVASGTGSFKKRKAGGTISVGTDEIEEASPELPQVSSCRPESPPISRSKMSARSASFRDPSRNRSQGSWLSKAIIATKEEQVAETVKILPRSGSADNAQPNPQGSWMKRSMSTRKVQHEEVVAPIARLGSSFQVAKKSNVREPEAIGRTSVGQTEPLERTKSSNKSSGKQALTALKKAGSFLKHSTSIRGSEKQANKKMEKYARKQASSAQAEETEQAEGGSRAEHKEPKPTSPEAFRLPAPPDLFDIVKASYKPPEAKSKSKMTTEEQVAYEEALPITDAERAMGEKVLKNLSSHQARMFSQTPLDILLVLRSCCSKAEVASESAQVMQRIADWRDKVDFYNMFNGTLAGADVFHKCWPEYIYGQDYFGHIITAIRVSDIDSDAIAKIPDETIERLQGQKMRGFSMFKEDLIRSSGKQRYKHTLIVDLSGGGMGLLSGTKRKKLQMIFGIGGTYFPETMWRIYLVNAPFVFRAAWSAVKPWLHPITLTKIKIFKDNAEAVKKMTTEENISKNDLPQWMGGQHKGQTVGSYIKEVIRARRP